MSQRSNICKIEPNKLPPILVGGENPLLVIAGPCQIESRDHALRMAEGIIRELSGLPVFLIYKSSFDKANRTSLQGERGIGIDEGLKVLEEVRATFSIPVITDIHNETQVTTVSEVVDLLQIPAFLCRQTDLLIAAGKSGKPINIKKGQFLHPSDMAYAAQKIVSTGNPKVMLCERGSCFGYRDLVVDMRSILIMKELGYPVIFDATHSVQSMGGNSGSSGGSRKYVPALIRAATAVGVDGLFIETHQNPDIAPSDGPNMIPLDQLRSIIKVSCALRSTLEASCA